jgi:hypothetical protein
LLLEEQRLGHRARVVAHNALLAQAHLTFQAAGAPMPAYTNPAPPPYFNPTPAGFYGVGASHAGPSTAPGQGKKKKKKGAAAPAPFAPPFTGARPPAPRPFAPALAGTFQAWAGPGILGSAPGAYPPTPTAPHGLAVHAAPAAPTAPPAAPPTQWDQSTLIAALNQMALQAQSGQDDKWVFDSGASSHMGSGSGMHLSPRPSNFPSHTIVGDGSSLPITGTGSIHFHTSTRPLSLLNILVSPKLIKNLVAVRAFTRDNFVSIEFDPFGFSIKDLATGRVIHRCNSTGDLYPFVQPSQCFLATVSATL